MLFPYLICTAAKIAKKNNMQIYFSFLRSIGGGGGAVLYRRYNIAVEGAEGEKRG